MTSIALLRELFAHQAWADTALLRAVLATPGGAMDEKLKATLHHVVTVQRVFTAMLTGSEIDVHAPPAGTVEDCQELFAGSHRDQLSFVATLTAEDLDRPVHNPWMPDLSGSVAQVLMQVVLHSQNHRGQCLTRLRELTGSAPTLDFIIWVKLGRPAPEGAVAGH